MYDKEEDLPYWFDKEDPKKINVIFIRNMDEFLAGEIETVSIGLYRLWLQPHKIAVPASHENIERYAYIMHILSYFYVKFLKIEISRNYIN